MLTVYSYLLFLVSLSLSAQLKGKADETIIDVLDKDLITRIPSQKEPEKCCNKDNLLTCERVSVDPDMLMQEDDIFILGIPFTFSNRIEPNGFVYKTEAGDEAVITYREVTGNMFGGIRTREGQSFTIEKCKGGHVLKEYDVASFGQDIGLDVPEDAVANVSRHVEYDPNDKTTMYSYSVMFYVTAKALENIADLDGFIDQVLAYTNQGYVNSQIPVRAYKLCTELATIKDSGSNDILYDFRDMKGSWEALRNTADAATLIVEDLSPGGYCGIAYTATTHNGLTISANKRDCLIGSVVFGHELGHNFGCVHNPEIVVREPKYPYGHGHLIAKGTSSEKASIMAYGNWINYYSDPSLIYPGTGTPTGVKDVSNCVKVITDNRKEMSELGDESAACYDNPEPTTYFPPTTDKPDVYENSIPIIDRKGKKYHTSEKTWQACESLCNEKDCGAWHFRERKKQCFLHMVTYRTKNNYYSGQNLCSGLTTVHYNTVPTVRRAKRYKYPNGNWEGCRELCKQKSCTTWSFKDNKKAKKRLCFLQTVNYSKTKNYYITSQSSSTGAFVTCKW